MKVLDIVSLLTPDGYFFKAAKSHGFLPNMGINLPPPALKPLESARINDTKDGWIIENDPKGLHAPAFEFNDVEQNTFIFDEKIGNTIPAVKYSLAAIRVLAKNAKYKVSTAKGEAFFTFRGQEIQNRLIYLNNNLKFISQETCQAYNIFYSNKAGMDMSTYNYLLYKTNFGIEMSVYCMRVSFDYLIQIACYFESNERSIYSIGSFLKELENNSMLANKIRDRIFKKFTEKNYEFLYFLNNVSNCYKHSNLQAFADGLHADIPIVPTVHLKNKREPCIAVSDCQYLQLVYAFHVSMAEAMNSIKDMLDESSRKRLEEIENDPTQFI